MDIVKETFKKMFEGFGGLFKNVGKEFNKSKQVFVKLIIIIVPIVIIIIIISLIISGVRNGNCADVRKKIGDNVDAYAMGENLYPTINGDNVIIDLDLIDKVTFKEEVCTGTVKITKVDDEYIKTFYLENCNYCTTGKFGKESNKFNKDASNVEVIVYFNYYTVTNNNSRWSDYIPFEDISTEETNGVMLPLNSEDLPKISEEAIVTEILKEDKTFYSFRDKRWLWYRVNNNDYSGFSSEQPAGYANKDTLTEKWTEYSEWSIDYPETKDYRAIASKTAYRWYKLDENKNKIYWSNGDYYPEKPEEDYRLEDDNKITMYRYRDRLWKWYNGTARGYSSLMSLTAPSKNYLYKDEDISSYSKWSEYKTGTSLTSENSVYREEKTNLHSRYMIKYKIRSFLVLEDYLERSEFETTLGRTIYDMTEDITTDLDVKFKYSY